MAIYHLSTKPISRSKGRSAVAAAAYRSGEKIVDSRTGLIHDFGKKKGVECKAIFTADGVDTIGRSELWNMAEKIEVKSNSRTAREIVIAIPSELQNQGGMGVGSDGYRIIKAFCRWLVERYGVAVDMAIHAPSEDGDEHNWHAHLLLTTRRYQHGTLGKKAELEWSDRRLKLENKPTGQQQIKAIRQEWADLANRLLIPIGRSIDHRSHKDRGLNIAPTIKMGQAATALERKGYATDKGKTNQAIRELNDEIEELNDIAYRQQREQKTRAMLQAREEARQAQIIENERKKLEMERLKQENQPKNQRDDSPSFGF